MTSLSFYFFKKCKREITLTNDRHSELLKKYAAVEKKSGWLERTLKDMEVRRYF